MSRWLRPGLMGGVFGTYVPSGGGGGGGGGSGPALPTLATSGLVLQQRLCASVPTAHLYKDNALTQQASAGDTVLGVKDLSGAGHNFADIQSGQGLILTANALNGKSTLNSTAGTSIIETRNSSYLSILRGAPHVTLFFIAQIGCNQVSYLCSASRRNDAAGPDVDSLVLRFGGAGGYITGGRMGGEGRNANGGYPLLTYCTDINAAWSTFTSKFVKVVLRACGGTSLTQKLDIAGTDGTNSGSHSTGYTNVAADVDSGSAAWDFLSIGNTYYSGSPPPYQLGMILLEWDVWTGPNQTSDADVAALMSYGTAQAGF